MAPQLIPCLVVHDARSAIAWYGEAFGARLVGEPSVMDDDRIGQAELEIGGAALYVCDPDPERGLPGAEDGRAGACLHLSVLDVGAAVARADGAGATVEHPAGDTGPGRAGVVVDPYGHRWTLRSRPAPAQPGPRPGDVVHLTLRVPDGARARDFYEAVLGWSAGPGHAPDGWQVENTTPMIGIGGGDGDPGAVPMYAVDDLEVAVAAVRTAGGTAGETESRSFGLSVLCRDDQGLPFWLGQLG